MDLIIENDIKEFNNVRNKLNKVLTSINLLLLNNRKLDMVDLCAGTGGFSLAFEHTNKINVIFANDMVESSKKIYDENFSHKLTLKDLHSVKVINIGHHEILTAGFPCQAFSIAGKMKGWEDPRSNIFWKILEIIDYYTTPIVILENVKNLTSHDNGDTFKVIISNLEKRNYQVYYNILNTAEITGVPQHRERIYIVCLHKELISDEIRNNFNLDFPKIPKKKIPEMYETNIPNKYYYTDASSTWKLVKNAIVKKATIYQYRRVYVRENKSNECPTLTANMGTGGHNVPLILDDKGIRKLTPRECFNFQGFPTTYKLPGLSDASLYKLSGNAISVPVVKLLSDRLISLLNISSILPSNTFSQ